MVHDTNRVPRNQTEILRNRDGSNAGAMRVHHGNIRYDGMMVDLYNQTYITHGLGGNTLATYGFSTRVNSVCFPIGGCLDLAGKIQPIKQATKLTWQPLNRNKLCKLKSHQLNRQLQWKTFPASVSGIARCILWQKTKKVWNIFWYLATAANDLKDSKKRGAKGNQEKMCFVQVCECVVVVQGSECLIAVRQKITFYSSNRFVSAHGWSSGLRDGLGLGSGVVRAPNSLAQTIYRVTSREMMCTESQYGNLSLKQCKKMSSKMSFNAPHHHIHQNNSRMNNRMFLRLWEGHQKQNVTTTRLYKSFEQEVQNLDAIRACTNILQNMFHSFLVPYGIYGCIRSVVRHRMHIQSVFLQWL